MRRRARTAGRPALGFAARMMLTLGLVLAGVGGLQYALVAHTLTGHASEQLVAAHSADAKVLRSVHDAPGNGMLEVEAPLDHLATRPGVQRVTLVDGDATVLAVGRGDFGTDPAEAGARPSLGALDERRTVGRAVAGADAAHLRRVAASGLADVTEDGDVTVVRVPIALDGRTGVLEVLRTGEELRREVGALRRVLLVTLAAGMLLALPAFYLLGGRRLSTRHGEALQTATTDALTGLHNHRAFHEDLRRKLPAAQQRGFPLTLVLVDLDGFKQVNDTHGHRRGDRVLHAVGAVLAEAVREAPRGARAYRVGGDEFALLLPGADAGTAAGLAEQVRATVERDVQGVTTSIGLAVPTGTPCGAEALLEHADAALYASKRGGRNRVSDAADVPARTQPATERFPQQAGQQPGQRTPGEPAGPQRAERRGTPREPVRTSQP